MKMVSWGMNAFTPFSQYRSWLLSDLNVGDAAAADAAADAYADADADDVASGDAVQLMQCYWWWPFA